MKLKKRWEIFQVFPFFSIYCSTGIRHRRMLTCQCISYQWIREHQHNPLLSTRQRKLHFKQNSRELSVQGNKTFVCFGRNLQDSRALGMSEIFIPIRSKKPLNLPAAFKCQKSNANIHPSIGFNCHNSPISVLINSLCIKSILGHFRSGKRKQSCSS